MTIHVPGTATTPRGFVNAVAAAARARARAFGVPRALLRLAGMFDPAARGAADMAHVWTHPVRLDGARYRLRCPLARGTPMADAVAETLAWHRANPSLTLQG
jgi:hypothetical protein